MYIISGCPRSGTSLMSLLMKEIYGEERFIGCEYPKKKLESDGLNKIPNEPDAHFICREYLFNKQRLNFEEIKKDSNDMNPLGFWECVFTVQGVFYDWRNFELLSKVENSKSPLICKIVSQGLAKSDPKYIDKIVYMIRHPKAVAKSQEKLIRKQKREFEIIHSPLMFITVTIQAAKWLKRFNKIPIHIVEYNNLIENPKLELSRVVDFIGEDISESDIDHVQNLVKKSLNRSLPEEYDHVLWDEAEEVYQKFKEGDLEWFENFSNKWDTYFNRENQTFICSRFGEHVTYHHCKQCMENPIFQTLFKNSAEFKGIDWKNEPCLYECGLNHFDKNPKIIEDSIINNSWIQRNI